MKALVYHGPGQKSWDDVPDPRIIDPTDAIIGVDATTICGTDLHILKGDVADCRPGRILGHEAVGTVEAVGSAVTTMRPGDRVLVSCVSACGRCRYCREGHYGQCLGGGGWILGYKIDGTQAEYVRVPFADSSTYPVPAGMDDEAVLMLADILPTAYEVGVINGGVRPGDTVAIVGAGPIGLSAILGAKLFSPAHVMNLTDELGADVAIEAVGVSDTFEMCARLVRPGGHVANVGVHGGPASLHLEDLWTRNVTITTGLVDTWSTPTLLKLVRTGQLPAAKFVTHHFALGDMLEAYDVFSRAADTAALKVVLTK